MVARRVFLRSLLATPAVAWAADLPRRAPELAIQLGRGQELLLSKFRGKVCAVEFLLTTCPHCQRSSQVLNKLFQEWGPRGFQPVGVAIDPGANVADYREQFRISFPVGTGTRDQAVTFLQHPVMTQMMMPQLAIVDRQGMIRHQYAGTDKLFIDEEKGLRSVIEPLLGEGVRSPAAAAAPRKKK